MSEKKRMAGDYEIMQAMHIGDREIVLGENPANTDGLTYMVACYESNGLMERYYDAVGSDDFVEMVETYGQRILEQAQKVREELATPRIQGIQNAPITAEGCTAISWEDTVKDKIVVIRPEVLRPEYRHATCQLQLCTGGNGAYGKSRGSACFCVELYSGKRSRFERTDVLGIMEPENLPKWAKHSLDFMEQTERNRKSENREAR